MTHTDLPYKALAANDIADIKNRFGMDPTASFFVPESVYRLYASSIGCRGKAAHATWTSRLKLYGKTQPAAYKELTRRMANELPDGWQKVLPEFTAADDAVGGRTYSEHILNAIAPMFPELMGCSADLTSSNYTRVKTAQDFQAPSTGLGDYTGTYLRYGVREHAMGAIMNGLSAYGGFIPFAGTFLNFVRRHYP